MLLIIKSNRLLIIDFRYSYSVDGNLKLTQVQHKDTSTRVVTFSHDGQKLISAFSDQTLKFYDVENGLQLERTIKNATRYHIIAIDTYVVIKLLCFVR